MKTKNILKPLLWLTLLLTLQTACQSKTTNNKNTMQKNTDTLATATFGAGCFWCVEAVFQQLAGVDTVISGYSGGQKANPTYAEVCSGNSGHVEVCQITYNPKIISYRDLLQAFFVSHDPTTLNRQGNDIGTQYRSVIFYHDPEQKEIANEVIHQLNEAKAYPSLVVTAVEPLSNFYPAENYHQNYYNLNGNEGYCRYVIKPKVEKFQQVFGHKLKSKTN